MTNPNKPAAAVRKISQYTVAQRQAAQVGLDDLNNLLAFKAPDVKEDEVVPVYYQKGMIYKSRPVPVVTYPLDEKGKAVTPFDPKLFQIKHMWVSELRDNFVTEDGDFSEEFSNVFLSKSARKAVGDRPQLWAHMLSFIEQTMGASEYQHLVGIRKTRITFSKRPFEEYQICRDFAEYSDPNRLEHLIQLINARGIKLSGQLDVASMKRIKTEAADGHVFLLTEETGASIGLVPGNYQHRSVGLYSKGTIVVSPAIKCDAVNLESIKVKKELPDVLRGEDILIIQSSIARPFDTMRMGHQDFYCLKSFGKFPQLILDALQTKRDGKDLIERSMPAEVSALVSLGLPYEYIKKPEGFEDSLLLQARPEVAHMFLASMMREEDINLPEGWYAPIGVLPAGYMSNLADRSPRMAIGGGFQMVEWERDDNGDLIPSPIPNSILLVVKTDEHDQPATEKSKTNWQVMKDLGADVDGDRLGISTPEGFKLRQAAGLEIKTNLPAIKAKNPYPNTSWSEEGRRNMSIQSNPRLIAVGMGDIPTQDARDMYLAKQIPLATWDQMAWAGANKVQEGVSAPKYFFKSPVQFPIAPMKLVEMMEELGVGRGAKRYGALYDPAREYINSRLDDVFPVTPKPVTVNFPNKGKTWEGGYGYFLDQLALHDAELGDNWINHVRRSFALAMRRLGVKNIKNKQENGDVKKYLARFIHDHPHLPHVWTWLLKPQYLGLAIDNKGAVLKSLGMPFSGAQFAKNKDIKVEGMDE